jgi:hypothetical protein
MLQLVLDVTLPLKLFVETLHLLILGHYLESKLLEHHVFDEAGPKSSVLLISSSWGRLTPNQIHSNILACTYCLAMIYAWQTLYLCTFRSSGDETSTDMLSVSDVIPL